MCNQVEKTGEERTDDLARSEHVVGNRVCLLEPTKQIKHSGQETSSLACNRYGTCNARQEQSRWVTPQVKLRWSLLPRSRFDNRVRLKVIQESRQRRRRVGPEIEGSKLPSDVSNATDLYHQSEVAVVIQSRYPYYLFEHSTIA